MNSKSSIVFIFKSIVVGLALAFIAVLLHPELLGTKEQPTTITTPPTAPRSVSTNPVASPRSYADAVDAALPSVVNIYIAKVSIQRDARPLFNDPLLQYLYGDQYLITPQKRLETSLGSGVIVGDGYILTNDHVVQGADRIQIALSGGRTFPAQVIGTDPDTDLALLKTDQSDLQAITIGQANGIRVGDVVLAIGNPFGVGQTVTMGIISATGRNRLGINTYENFIQTDAAINPGNSGGALINASGELIGINTAIFSKSGGSQGIGFAIPVDLAMSVKEQLIRHGRVVRGWMGISAVNMNHEIAKTFELPEIPGALITHVIEGSPAAEGGLLPGDIITQLDDKPLQDSIEMMQFIANTAPGVQVVARGQRGKHRFEIQLIMAERPKQSSQP